MEKIKQILINESENDYKKFSSNLIPNIDNILGIRIPTLRKISKQIYTENWQDFLNEENPEFMEETMLQGMVISQIKDTPEKILEYIKDFVPKINNWAICDTFCCGLKFTKKNKEIVWNFIQTYLQSDKEYEIRFAVVMLLSYFIEEKYIDEILKLLNKINHDGYYVKMAVAWAVSICYIKFPEKTHKFLEHNNLENWVHNKSIQKIVESYRIDAQTKILLKQMKRK